jgi:glycosyltransferase involved in cell wall biosynthesis
MPRKNLPVFHMIACIFRSRFPQFYEVPFVEIDQMDHTAVAKVLGESAVFLATGFPEGLARPPLEAMASGCIVVGFSGRGSLEYMINGENCYLAEDYDALTAALGLGAAVERYQNGHALAIQTAARRTALNYGLEVEESRIARFWSRYMNRALYC